MSAASSRAHSGRRHRRRGNDTWWRDGVGWRDRWFLDKQAEHDAIGSGGAGRQKPMPPLPPEGFTHVLIGGPTLPARRRWAEAHTGEPVSGREIGNVEPRHLVAPHVARQLVHGRYAPLGEVPVPLRPERILFVAQVESVDDIAALPPVVARRLRPSARVRFVRKVTQPCANSLGCIDVECRRARPQTAPGDSSSDTTRATLRALPRAISSSGFWSSSASIGLESHTGM